MKKSIKAIFYNIVNTNKKGFTGKVDKHGRRIYKGDILRYIGYVDEEKNDYGIRLDDGVFKPLSEPHFWNWFNPSSIMLFVNIK